MYLEVTFADGTVGRYECTPGATVTVAEPDQTTSVGTIAGQTRSFALADVSTVALVTADLAPVTQPLPVDAPPAEPEAPVEEAAEPVEEPAVVEPVAAAPTAAPPAAPVEPLAEPAPLPTDAIQTSALIDGPEAAASTAAVVVAGVTAVPAEVQPDHAKAALADVVQALSLYPDNPGLLDAQTQLEALISAEAPV